MRNVLITTDTRRPNVGYVIVVKSTQILMK